MENQGKYWDLYQQIKDLKKKQKKQLHKLYIDFALLLFFEWTGKKYHKIILKKVLTLMKNGGKLMPSSRGLTSELNIKTI